MLKECLALSLDMHQEKLNPGKLSSNATDGKLQMIYAFQVGENEVEDGELDSKMSLRDTSVFQVDSGLQGVK